MSFGTLTKGG